MRECRFASPAAVIGLLVLLSLAACGDDSHDPRPLPDPQGVLVDASGCLGKVDDENPLPRDRGFLFWSYDADTGALRLDHVNAGLNCCPEYTAAVTVTADSLIITEIETAGLCDCVCLYRFTFEVTDLPVGVYEIVVREECLAPGDPPLAGVIDLTGAEFGTIQALRGHYPWDPGS